MTAGWLFSTLGENKIKARPMQLDGRQIEVLRTIVDTYIATAQPVSSGAVVTKASKLGLSSATIRSIMSDLEHRGLLNQPHKSAGRIPTETGLRIYLNIGQNRHIRPRDRRILDAFQPTGEPVALVQGLAQQLSSLTGQTTVVAIPRFTAAKVSEIGLVRCTDKALICYFVSPGGHVQQTMVELSRGIDDLDLTKVQNYLNEKLVGHTLTEVRTILASELSGERTRYDAFVRRAAEIGQRALPASELEVCIDGASHLAAQPEFSDATMLRRLLGAIEEREVVLTLIDELLAHSGVQVVLSSEHSLEGLGDLSVVSSSLPSGQDGQGPAIGLLGPARMDYGRLIPMVGYATELLGKHWNGF